MRAGTTALVFIAGLLLAAPVFAQGTGRSLDIQPGARENGMGAAGVALAESPSGMTWWNPAGLGFARKFGADVTGAQLVPGLATDVYYMHVAAVTPIEGLGSVGFSNVFLSYGESEGVDITGQPTGRFTSYEVSPALSYGVQLIPNVAFGVTAKWIRIQLAPQSYQGVGSTVGFDLGGLWKIPIAFPGMKVSGVNAGVVLQNLGPSVTFINEDQASPLSRNLKAGFAAQGDMGGMFHLGLVADYNQSLVTSSFRTYNGGVELGVKPSGEITATLRAGYYYDKLGDIRNLTFGLGGNIGPGLFDFAAIPQARDSGLDYVKKFTLGLRV